MMEFIVTETSGVTKAALDGRLDTLVIDRIELPFTASILSKGQNTVIDLSNMTFIASLGVRMLLTIARALTQRGAKLAMFGATPKVTEIIKTTALFEIIPIFVLEDDAIAAVNT